VERSSSQILFNYLPGKTFDHETYRVICRVDRVDGERLEEIDRETLVRRVNAKLEAAIAARNSVVNFDERSRRDPSAWTIKRPTQVVARVFPLLLQCRLGCKRVYSLNEDGSGPRNRVCPHCQKRLTQVQQILFHECGTIRSLEVPACPRHGRGNIALDDRGSLSTSDWRWLCKAAGCNQTVNRSLTRRCDCGTYRNTLLRTDLYRSSHVFRPLKEQIIDFPVRERRLFAESSNAAEATIAAFLGVAEDQIRFEEQSTTQQEAEEKLLASLSADLAEKLRGELEQKRQSLPSLSDQVSHYFENSAKPDVVEETLDFVVAKRGVGFAPWQDIVEDPALQGRISSALEGSGISQVHFSPKFPTSVVVYGYSRGGSDTGNAAILGFGREGDRHVMYGSENRSDAVLVELSPKKLLSCVGIDELDPVRAKARVASLVATRDPKGITVRSIVHTFAHAFLKAVSVWSGLDSNSLAEYLFPAAGAFAVYEIVGAGISMGGMKRMVDKHLVSVVEEFLRVLSSCTYDPACIERLGACFACVHLAEISCQDFNNGLDRRLLVGDSGYLRDLPA